MKKARSQMYLKFEFFGLFLSCVICSVSMSFASVAILDFDFIPSDNGIIHGFQFAPQPNSLPYDSQPYDGIGGGGLDFGVSITGLHANGDARNPLIFDTEILGSTPDPDLQRTGTWSGGNVPLDTVVGGALIVEDNPNPSITNGRVTNPDDEELGGTFIFDIAADFDYRIINALVVDFEEPNPDRYVFRAFERDGPGVAVFSAADFMPPLPAGNNFINRIPELDAGFFFDRLEVEFVNSSGALGELTLSTTSVPEVNSILPLAILLGCAVSLRYRQPAVKIPLS